MQKVIDGEALKGGVTQHTPVGMVKQTRIVKKYIRHKTPDGKVWGRVEKVEEYYVPVEKTAKSVKTEKVKNTKLTVVDANGEKLEFDLAEASKLKGDSVKKKHNYEVKKIKSEPKVKSKNITYETEMKIKDSLVAAQLVKNQLHHDKLQRRIDKANNPKSLVCLYKGGEFVRVERTKAEAMVSSGWAYAEKKDYKNWKKALGVKEADGVSMNRKAKKQQAKQISLSLRKGKVNPVQAPKGVKANSKFRKMYGTVISAFSFEKLSKLADKLLPADSPLRNRDYLKNNITEMKLSMFKAINFIKNESRGTAIATATA